MPFLVRAATGLPLQAPSYWIVSKRRPSGSQPNTLHNDLRALMYLYLWADARGVDLQDRFESGALPKSPTSTPSAADTLSRLSPRTSSNPKRVDVRDLGFRWGSCGKSGIVYFNWKTLQLPVRLVDYVIAHELVHLRESHHGLAFWEALGRAMPDWRKRKEALASQAKDYLIFGLSA